jgi:hypothetical protein
MNYEVLTIIVVVNALVTFALWRSMRGKANRPKGLNKRAAKLLWDSDPIIPKHNPPEVAGGRFASLVDADDYRFFTDFAQFADVVNSELADGYTQSPWRLQDLPDGDRRIGVDFDHGPILGRSFELFYNKTSLGRLEIGPGHPYSAENPQVNTAVEIRWVRLLGFHAINELFDCVAMYVTDPRPNSDEYVAARQYIQRSLTETLWDSTFRISKYDHPDDEDWGELTVRLSGSAAWYLQQRKAWREGKAPSPATKPANATRPAKPKGVAGSSGWKLSDKIAFAIAIALTIGVILTVFAGRP